ncbi:MAG TPA: metalloregulator ArsR/SmtB family transcription factor [Acidobacteriota bacterium]|nr:metalloregulator ArsR/SmtB family transcription factor [Acidobacteriota bacterium]
MQTKGREFKDRIYQEFARIGKAISSPRRLELLDLLCQGPRTVEELSKQAGQSVANTSQHLQVLRSSRLVEAVKRGHFVTYSLADNNVLEFFRSLRTIAEDRLGGIERVRSNFLEERGVEAHKDSEKLMERVHAGEAILVDFRPLEEYLAGHIPGAISLPYEDFDTRIKDLPKDKGIIAYCRGSYCAAAIEAVRRLREQGFAAERLEDGVIEWKARGLNLAFGEN